MAISSHHLRSIAHKLLTDSECHELKCAIQDFKQDKSVLMLCASLYKILNTPEKTQILLSVYPMIPHNMQADFDSLCCLQFDVYASLLRPEIIKRYGAKSAKRGSPIQNQPMMSIQQLRRFHTPRDCKSPDRSKSRPHKGDQHTATSARDSFAHQRTSPEPSPRAVTSNRESYTRRRASPDPSPPSRSSRRQRQRKRSKTAHAGLGRKPGGNPPTIVESPRVPPLNLNTSNGHNSSGSMSSTPRNITVRKVRLERRGGESLGFAIRGGTDLKSGIYVSEIDSGGQAERRGLRVGERILKVNDVTFKGITHAEAVACLKASYRLTIYVAPIGHMPGPAPTPRSGCSSGRSSGSDIKNSARSPRSTAQAPSSSSDENRRITVMADDDSWLGCSIRGGVDLDMEVIVASIDHDSPAYKAGLKKGQHIVKVNDVSVANLTHTQVINLITASKIVRFEVKPGFNKKSRGHRRSSKLTSKHSNASDKLQCPPAAASVPTRISPTPLMDRPSTSPTPLIDRPSTSPIPLIDQSNINMEMANELNNTPQNWQDFEKELMSTPPVNSSTPLPPDNHPLLLGNRQQQYISDDDDGDDGDKTIANIEDEATIIQMLHRVGKNSVDPEPDSDPDELLANDNHNSTTCNNITQYSKFDKGTIKLNMAEPSHKDMLKTAKIINISILPEPSAAQKGDTRRRLHVKEIFANYPKPNIANSGRSESCRTQIRHSKTPQKERSNSLNILGSPYSNVDQEVMSHVTSPDKAQLRDARPNARIQLKQELTGKRLVLSPNVPLVAPNSPVSNFLRRVKKNIDSSGTGSTKTLKNMSGSLESLGTDGTGRSHEGKKLNRPGISKWRSAYDFVAKSDSDED